MLEGALSGEVIVKQDLSPSEGKKLYFLLWNKYLRKMVWSVTAAVKVTARLLNNVEVDCKDHQEFYQYTSSFHNLQHDIDVL